MSCSIPDLANTLANLHEVLDELPDTADEIAATFKELGIKGTRGSMTCPLAAFIDGQVVMPKGAVLTVHKEELFIDAFPFWVAVDLPPGVAEFINRFDRGQYPALDEHVIDGELVAA